MKPFKGSLTGAGQEIWPGVSENQGKPNSSGKSLYPPNAASNKYDPLGASADSRPEIGDNRKGNPVPGPSGTSGGSVSKGKSKTK